jgi:hypothetical protein
VNPEKDFLDLSDSSASRKLNAGEIHWLPLHFDKVHRINHARIPASVKWTLVLFQTLLQSNPKGFQTKLMDSALTGQVLFGKWSECLICQWAGIDMVTDPYSLGDYFQIRVCVNSLFDVQFRHNLAFCTSVDSGAQ